MTPNARLAVAALGAAGVGIWAGLVRGSLTIDLGKGRTVQPLGPLTWRIAAPRELVYEVLSSPYLERTPKVLTNPDTPPSLDVNEDLFPRDEFSLP